MSSLRKSPPDLLSLPNEILAKICAYADDDNYHFTCGLRWLKAVRLTCKQLSVPATTEFIKRFFRRLEVIISRHGLREFAELCKHPLFGPHVQEVSFDACRLNSKFVQNLGSRMDFLITKNKLGALKQAREYLNWYLTKLQEELHFEESGDSSVLLEQAFSALRLHGRPIELNVETFFDFFWRPHPIGHKDLLAGRPDAGEFDDCDAFACRGVSLLLVKLLKLASAAGCRIRCLYIQKRDLDHAGDSDEPVNLEHDYKTALTGLKRLVLHIGEHDRVKDVDKTLEAFLLQAKGLESFELMFIESDDREEGDEKPPPSTSIHYASQVTRMLSSNALRQIRLDDISIFEIDLLRMLTRHQNTLKEMVFSDFILAGSWDRVLLCIRDKLRLERFVIVDAKETDEDDLEEGGGYGEIWLDGGVELNGNEKVTSGLTDVLDQKSRERTEPDFEPDWKYGNSIRSLMDMAQLRG